MAQGEVIKVLIIDDNEEDAMILQRYMKCCRRYDIETEYAADLHQALEKIAKTHFDLTFLDNRLGGGLTAQHILWDFREKNINIPVVVFTGTCDQKTAVELIKAGACDYIVKDNLTAEIVEKTIFNTIERHTLKIRQKQSEREIRQQKELLANIISNIPHFVFWKDKNSVYLGCNKNFANIAGVGCMENIVGKTDYELSWRKAEADFFARYDREIMESGRPLLGEESLLQLDDREITFLASKVPLNDPKGNIIGLLGIYADITEHKRTQKILEALNEELEIMVEKLTSSNRELQDIINIVAHDLKAPARAIGIMVDWIATDYGDKFDKLGQDKIKLLRARAKRMSSLMDGILKYAEVRDTRQKSKEVDLNILLTELISEINPPENIEITISGKLPTVICDETCMMQVFRSLLDNAVKFMDKPEGRIEIDCVKEDDFWKFSVADNGQGIEEKYFEKIFKIFQTLSRRDEIESTGIGLTVVKKIVELNDGKVWVQSKPGQGSAFFFTLPKRSCVKRMTAVSLKK